MGTCPYCRQSAGLLKSEHPACKEKHDAGWIEMMKVALSAGAEEIDFRTAEQRMGDIAATSYHDPSSIRNAKVAAWELVLEKFLEVGLLSEDEESFLINYKNEFGLEPEELNRNGAFTIGAMASLLRRVFSGEIPSTYVSQTDHPFNLRADETLVWHERSCTYLEERTVRQYVGASHGASVRVMKGVYYRFGAFKGHPVETSSLQSVDVGNLGITNRHIYFGGSKKSFRIPFNKVVQFVPYSDGFGLFRDAANSRQQVFVAGHGWFYMNLVTNLAKMHQSR